MNASPRGYLKAEIYGLPFTFDGWTWTYPEIPEDLKEFFGFALMDLNSSMARQGIDHHMQLGMRAESMLNYAVATQDWKIVEIVPDPNWGPLPPGSKD